MVELFLHCCERFLASDAELIRRLREHGFNLIDNGWNFTLPELHRFLVAASDVDTRTYKSFRQCLFKSTTNTYLAGKGGVIVVTENRGKVDLSTYRLQPRTGSGTEVE